MKTKKTYIYFINILITLSIFMIILKLSNIYPFGELSFGISDGLGQFKPMIYDLLMRIKLGVLTSYSFSNGLGNPTIFNVLYYTSSPIELVGLLFNDPNAMYFYPLLVKLVITSINTTLYSKSKTNSIFAIIIANIAYCFSSWFITYYYYSTFVDIFMMFPLFQYGLEKLLDENDKKIYIFSLVYMIISNFYLSFSVCVYTVVFFFMREILYKKNSYKEKLSQFKNIAIATIIVFFLSFFWLYMLIDSYSRMGLSFDGTYKSNYFTTITSFLSSVFYGQNYLIVEGSGIIIPNIGCITIILISLVYYFFNDSFPRRERFYVFVCLLLVADFMLVPQMDFVLNLFHSIRGLAYRYAFIPTFLTIMIFLRNSSTIDLSNKDSKKRLLLSIALISILFVVVYSCLSYAAIVVYIMLIAIIFVIMFLYQKNSIFYIMLILATIVQIFLVSSKSVLVRYSVEKEQFDTNYIKETTKYREGGQKNLCRRHNIDVVLPDNCNMYANASSISLFTSMTYGGVIYTLNRFGYNAHGNTSIDPKDYEKNLFVDMVYNVKNKYYLEKIYSVNKKIKSFKFTDDIITNQNTAIEKMSGVKSIISYDEELSKKIKEKVLKNHTCNSSFKTLVCKKGAKTILTKLDTEPFEEYLVYNDTNVEKAYDILKKNQIEYTKYKDNIIEGTINVDENQLIFTSIPYDTNWKISIDGKRVNAIRILDSLIGIEVRPGKHKIKMEYKSNFLIPFLVSITSLIVVVVFRKKI